MCTDWDCLDFLVLYGAEWRDWEGAESFSALNCDLVGQMVEVICGLIQRQDCDQYITLRKLKVTFLCQCGCLWEMRPDFRWNLGGYSEVIPNAEGCSRLSFPCSSPQSTNSRKLWVFGVESRVSSGRCCSFGLWGGALLKAGLMNEGGLRGNLRPFWNCSSN